VFTASAPGRVDFLNTHQDYKGLPVVPIAINLRTYVTVIEESNYFEIKSEDLCREGKDCIDKFSPSEPSLLEGRWWGNYLRAVVKAVEEHLGEPLRKGFKATITSNVPVGSGLSSSAALEVSFLKAIDHFYNLGLSKKDLAELAFQAENRIAGIPCGRLDQYSSAFGGIILLRPKPPVEIEELKPGNVQLIVVDSGIRHSVADIHPVRQEEINSALRKLMENPKVPRELREKLGYRYDQPKWEQISLDEIEPYLDILAEKERKRILFTILMQASTMRAVEKMRRENWNPLDIAPEINYQHELLRDLYDVSLPQLEKIRDAMLKAGALAVKLSGAGMGGSLIALVEKNEEEIVKSALSAGANQAWKVWPDSGARIEE
jgi:galactokinase